MQQFDFLVGLMYTVIHRNRLDFFSTFLKDRRSQDYMQTGDIVAIQVCQFLKDRDEQARCKSICVIPVAVRRTRSTERGRFQYILCGRRRLLTAMQFFNISNWRRKLLAARQLFTMLHTFSGSRRVPAAIQCFTILHIV